LDSIDDETVQRRVESAFEKLLDHIADANREPTVWEGKCLFAALMAMATDDYLLAGSMINTCERGATDSWGLTPPKSGLTIEGMRAALAMLREWQPCPSGAEQA
jgi:hypothetical protein